MDRIGYRYLNDLLKLSWTVPDSQEGACAMLAPDRRMACGLGGVDPRRSSVADGAV